MAQKKEVRSDNTYLITEESTANPKLGAKILANGTESLFLDFYYGASKVYDPDKDKMIIKKSRKREYLKLYLWRAPRTPQERNDNKETLELAKKIRDEREQETKEIIDGYRIRVDDKNLLTYWDSFIENEDVADKRLMKAALNNFRRFLKEEYPMFADRIEPKQLRPDMMQRFVDFLVDNHKGQGVMTYYKRFKRLINYAISRGIIKNNPCKGKDGKPIAPPPPLPPKDSDKIFYYRGNRTYSEELPLKVNFIKCMRGEDDSIIVMIIFNQSVNPRTVNHESLLIDDNELPETIRFSFNKKGDTIRIIIPQDWDEDDEYDEEFRITVQDVCAINGICIEPVEVLAKVED